MLTLLLQWVNREHETKIFTSSGEHAAPASLVCHEALIASLELDYPLQQRCNQRGHH